LNCATSFLGDAERLGRSKTSDVIVHKMPFLETIKVPTFRWTPFPWFRGLCGSCIHGT